MFTIVHESWLCHIQYSHHLPRPSDHNWLQLVASTCQDIRTKLSGRVTTLPSLGRRPKPLHSAGMKLVSMLRNNPETTKVQLWHEQESAVILGPMSSEFYFMVNWEGFRKKPLLQNQHFQAEIYTCPHEQDKWLLQFYQSKKQWLSYLATMARGMLV